MNEFLSAKAPAWPTPAWVLGEVRVYLFVVITSAVAFLLAASIVYSTTGWMTFSAGLAMGTLATVAVGNVVWRASRQALRSRRGALDSADGAEFRDDLQKLLDSAERIAAENEALRSDIQRLRRRAFSH